VHNGMLVLPYAMSDMATAVVSIPLDQLLENLLAGAPTAPLALAAAASAAAATA
jgi:hypothetical protein